MAKWGEGDPRWIVEERPDATNVNNWHWTEKNATPWSKDRLKSLFNNFEITEPNAGLNIKVEVDSINGEATANNRKGKLIFFYEWNIDLLWSGKLPGSPDTHKGKISIPNLSEENGLDEIEITVSVNESNVESEQLKVFMYNVGRDKIRQQIGIYLKELTQEFSKGLILPKKDEAQSNTAPKENTLNKKEDIDKFKSGTDVARKSDDSNSLGCKIDCKTLKFKIKFQCRSGELYNVFTKPEMVAAFTRSEVKLEPTKGGEYVLFGGNVHGHFQELIPNEKITKTWRLKQWPDGHFSQVTMFFEEKGDHTELQFTQTGVPSNDFETTKNNWKRYYWNSIKQVFGFGVPIVG